jgi:uncharacterized spore protein YtfJ
VAIRRSGGAEIRRLLRRVAGSRLTYGKAVRAGQRTIIPVSKTYIAGGFGFGPLGGRARDAGTGDDGGGGGGLVVSRPVGFIDAGPDGARFQPIDSRGRARVLAGAAAAGAVAGTVLAGTAVGTVAARRMAAALRPVAQRGAARVRRRRGGRLPSPRRLRRR